MDLLDDPDFVTQIELILDNFDKTHALHSWESIKLKTQTLAMKRTAFRQKQCQKELVGLKRSLQIINKHIYAREAHLENDRINLQGLIDDTKILMFSKASEEDIQWIVQEGKMCSGFLNLEKKKYCSKDLESVRDEHGLHTSTDNVLYSIQRFYTDLYSNCDSKSQEEINAFLEKILSLLKISQDTAGLAASISEEEVLTAIKLLQIGKAPGCDGLTAEFFKIFEESLASILVAVFANVWDNKKMSDSQRLAIIILLFKKGDPQLLANYRPISLTNADYKVLAYVMSNSLSLHLTDVITVNQTAYMPSRFIGTNIHFVQDTMDYFAVNSPQSAIIFLDFKKAFDSVSHKFLFSLLSHIGCPSDFVE